MATFRVEKTKDFTIMSNHHLKNKALSLKAKGLLSLMLSLPETWDYTLNGLAKICGDGVSSIRSGIKELEENGYLSRERTRNEKGQLTDTEYIIREIPKSEKPTYENPILDKPILEKDTQSSTKKLSTKELSIQSINHDRVDRFEKYYEVVKENIDYATLRIFEQGSIDKLDEIVLLITDTLCSTKNTIRIGGEERHIQVVKSVFMKLKMGHIQYVLKSLHENITNIQNIKNYMLTCLYNSSMTSSNYYTAKVNHDLYGVCDEDN